MEGSNASFHILPALVYLLASKSLLKLPASL